MYEHNRKTDPDVQEGKAVENPLKALIGFGQSVWLDYIRRSLISTGELKRLIDEDGLRGVTSNPSIFEKAITGSTDYTKTLEELEKRKDLDAKGIFDILAVKDIQDATDTFKQVYEQTKRRDGYVSLEVSPYLAHKTQETLDEARRLWKLVGRPNTMIKVPGTKEGIPAFQQLISEGININVTLLFAQEVYERVAEAYIAGLEEFAKKSGDLSRMASVASFFVSRIDTLIDSQLEDKIKKATDPAQQQKLRQLKGRVAIANAKLAYQSYKKIFSGPRWAALAARGAQTQRVLWASTSTKDPSFPDTYYVEELIGPDTVDTIPPATLDAFRDHGKPRASLEENIAAARQTMETLAQVGISMKEATDKLTEDGVKLFADAFDKLLAAVSKRTQKASSSAANNLTYHLPEDLGQNVKATLEDWKKNNKVKRLWARDASLWTNKDDPTGWDGSVSWKNKLPTMLTSRRSRTKSIKKVSPISFCWAWVAPAFASKYSGKPSARSMNIPKFISSTQPTPLRSARSRATSISQKLFSLSPVNQVRRSNQISSSNISTKK